MKQDRARHDGLLAMPHPTMLAWRSHPGRTAVCHIAPATNTEVRPCATWGAVDSTDVCLNVPTNTYLAVQNIRKDVQS